MKHSKETKHAIQQVKTEAHVARRFLEMLRDSLTEHTGTKGERAKLQRAIRQIEEFSRG